MAAQQTGHAGRANKDSTFRILVATDVHLGYKHLDPVLGNDSLNTFQEVLQLAQVHEVDFILLGGDLFHHNKPPRDVLYDCCELLKKYCLGERSPTFEIVAGDPGKPEAASKGWNISIPVFSIHGNHDEPTGPKHLSVMDLLHSTGLVWHFGKTDSTDEIQVKPVLLKKGGTQLALYGVGSIRSDKLQKMFLNKKVIMERPKPDPEDWFSIFVLHQNHVQRPDNTHVEEASIPGFLDLVIWGHEHESKLQPRKVLGDGGLYDLSQPGSTIATQFKKSEMVQKHVGILTVQGRKFQLQPVALKTVRQMYIVDHVPAVMPEDKGIPQLMVQRLTEDCHHKVEEALEKAEKSRGPYQPVEPLIRIKVQQQQELIACSPFRFGLRYKGKVANPDSILAFGRKMTDDDSAEGGLSFTTSTDCSVFTVQDLLQQQLRQEPLSFHILQEEDLVQAVKEVVESEGKHVVKTIIGNRLKTVQDQLKVSLPASSRRSRSASQRGVSGPVPGETLEITDSDQELWEEIDRLLAASHNLANTSQESPVCGGSNLGSVSASEDTHRDTSLGNQSGGESWLLEAEDTFFNAPSTSTQSSSTPLLYRTDIRHHRSVIPAFRQAVSDSSSLADRGLSTSALSRPAVRKTASLGPVATSSSADSRGSGTNRSQSIPFSEPLLAHVPSPRKRPRVAEPRK